MCNKNVRNIGIGDDTGYEYIVAMGISTGGPKLLSQIIPRLDPNLSATYLIVQHMPEGFTKNLAKRLDSISDIGVKEASHKEVLKRGVAYIAPGGKQLRIFDINFPYIEISQEESSYKGLKPSVNVMLQSLDKLKDSNKIIIAVIMTGMGNDGLEGVRALKINNKECKVIAQDKESSTIYGMPKSIVESGLADYVVSADDIVEIIKKIVGDKDGR